MKIKGCPLNILQVSVENYIISGSIQIGQCEPQSGQLGTAIKTNQDFKIKTNYQAGLIFNWGWLTFASSLPLLSRTSSHPQNYIISCLCYEKHLLETDHICS